MGSISGYVELDLSRTSGDIESITVDGSQFSLEEGGDWSRDRDDGELCAGFLFIAFCDCFELHLSVSIHANTITNYSLSVHEGEFEGSDIESIVITKDELDVSNLFPAEDEDIE